MALDSALEVEILAQKAMNLQTAEETEGGILRYRRLIWHAALAVGLW